MDAEMLIQEIRRLPPNEMKRIVEFVESQKDIAAPDAERPRIRKPGLHPGAMKMAPDFDAPLPDSFWLGEE